jgi:hypothetical protein
MEEAASPGFTKVTELLLDLTFAERKKIESVLRKHEKSALSVRTMEAVKVYIEIRDETDDEQDAGMATTLAAATQKPTIVLYRRVGLSLSSAGRPRNHDVSRVLG